MSSKFSQIQLLVSMVTDRVMMGKTVSPLFLGCFSSVPFLGRESKKNGVVLNKYSILVFRRILYTLYSRSIVQLYSV